MGSGWPSKPTTGSRPRYPFTNWLERARSGAWTFGGNNRVQVWSGDGKRVAFQSDRDGERAIFWQPAEGGAAERLTRPEPGTFHTPESWSSSADVLLFSITKELETTLWTLSLRDRKASRFGDVTSVGVPTNAVAGWPLGRLSEW